MIASGEQQKDGSEAGGQYGSGEASGDSTLWPIVNRDTLRRLHVVICTLWEAAWADIETAASSTIGLSDLDVTRAFKALKAVEHRAEERVGEGGPGAHTPC